MRYGVGAMNKAEAKRLVAEREGCLTLRRARATGTLVGLYRAAEAGMDPEAGRYATVCEDHGVVVNHETRRLAESSLAHPDEWCQGCGGVW